MGRLTKDEQDQINRTQDAVGFKLSREQIVKILGRNPFDRKPGRPLAVKKVKATQTKDVEPLYLNRLFAEKKKRVIPKEVLPEDLEELFRDKLWVINLVAERNSPRFPSETWRHYFINIAQDKMTPDVI